MRLSRFGLLSFFGEAVEEGEAPAILDLVTLHESHGEFVFACLQRLGVRDAWLEDAHQDVFLVVHRKLGAYDHRSSVNAWLFGICRRVAAAHRRKAHWKHEVPADPDWDEEALDANPEAAVARGQERRRVERLLDKLDDEKRVVLVMFEVEGLSCERIATALGIPVGTVYSRLHCARRDFEKAFAREAHRNGRTP